MLRPPCRCAGGGAVGIAVAAAGRTGVVGADVHAFTAAAAGPLAPVGAQPQRPAAQALQPGPVDTGGPADAVGGEVPRLAAGHN